MGLYTVQALVCVRIFCDYRVYGVPTASCKGAGYDASQKTGIRTRNDTHPIFKALARFRV